MHFPAMACCICDVTRCLLSFVSAFWPSREPKKIVELDKIATANSDVRVCQFVFEVSFNFKEKLSSGFVSQFRDPEWTLICQSKTSNVASTAYHASLIDLISSKSAGPKKHGHVNAGSTMYLDHELFEVIVVGLHRRLWIPQAAVQQCYSFHTLGQKDARQRQRTYRTKRPGML